MELRRSVALPFVFTAAALAGCAQLPDKLKPLSAAQEDNLLSDDDPPTPTHINLPEQIVSFVLTGPEILAKLSIDTATLSPQSTKFLGESTITGKVSCGKNADWSVSADLLTGTSKQDEYKIDISAEDDGKEVRNFAADVKAKPRGDSPLSDPDQAIAAQKLKQKISDGRDAFDKGMITVCQNAIFLNAYNGATQAAKLLKTSFVKAVEAVFPPLPSLPFSKPESAPTAVAYSARALSN